MHPVSDRRPCDDCVYMADTYHPDICLHSARRDPGALGDALDKAIHWNHDCPMQQQGRPAFCVLLDLGLPVEEWAAAGEYLRARIAEDIAAHGRVLQQDVAHYAADYAETRALVV